MERLKKIIRVLDWMEDTAVLLGYLSLFLVGLYALYDSYLVYQSANDTGILKYKPGYSQETAAETKEIQGLMAAWLTMEDTNIDYPVMQGENNTEYLNKDPFGEYSLSGSIFLDSRNTPDFTDDYSLIYGHHMDGGLMFGALDEYLDEDYFDAHRAGTLTVGEESYDIRVFAVLETEATNEAIFAPSETPASDTWRYIEQHALYLDETAKDKDAPLLALSTCKFPATAERTVVLGTLHPVKEDPKASE